VNRMILTASLVVVLGAGACTAQDEPDGALRAELAPLQFLADSCWQGVFPGSESFDIHCYAPMLDGQYLRDFHAVPQGATLYTGETVFHWDGEAEIIRYRYFNSLGGVSDGTAVPDGDLIRFPDEHHVDEDGAELVISSTMQRDGDNAYRLVSHNVTGEEPVEMFAMRFDRLTRAEANEMMGEDIF
jgi:hypothetical protein